MAVSGYRMLSAALLLGVLSGCAGVPDAGSFVDATIALRGAVSASGAAVADELRGLPGAQMQADDLARQWAVRVQTADALIAYSEAVQRVAKAGRRDEQPIASLADALTGLASSVGLAAPAASVALVSDAASFVYGHIKAVRASRTLDEALNNAQPAIERVAAIYAQDLRDLDQILQASSQLAINRLTVENKDGLAFRNTLKRSEHVLYLKQELTPEDEARLLMLSDLMRETEAWHAPLQQELQGIRTRLHAGRELLAATAESVNQWALAHRQMAAAVRDRRQVDSQALADSIVEVRSLVRRIREL